MHRRLQFARSHRFTDFCNEGAALAAMTEQLAGLVLIATGLKPDDLDVQPRTGGMELPGDLFGLRECHHALARADT
jgi:hypothetical protein